VTRELSVFVRFRCAASVTRLHLEHFMMVLVRLRKTTASHIRLSLDLCREQTEIGNAGERAYCRLSHGLCAEEFPAISPTSHLLRTESARVPV
jgi:hypothetical protein